MLDGIRADLEQLVAIPSTSSLSPAIDRSNTQLVAWLADRLASLGATVELLAVPGHPGKQNIVATLGRGDDALILSGHTDTVPFDFELWQSDPFKLTERNASWYGLGACDMKGFFAYLIAALELLGGRQVGARLRRPIVIVGTANEECDMAGARALLEHFAARPSRLGKHAIIGEPTGGTPIRMHKGVAFSELVIQGRAGHSSMPDSGLNAISVMQDALHHLDTVAEGLKKLSAPGFTPPYATMNLGIISGGDAANRICGSCTLQYDTRLIPGTDAQAFFAQLDGELVNIARQRGATAIARRVTETLPAFETSAHADIVRVAEELTGTQASSVPFATEGPFFNTMGLQTLIWGAGDISVAHQANEHIHIATIEPYVRKLAAAIARFCLDA